MRRLILLASLMTQLGATDCGQVLRDSSFDLWCEDELCAWKVTRGSIKKVPTWNEGDYGVELVGNDAAIQQLAPVNHTDGTCIRFHLIADVDDRAEVYLDVDVQGDGTVELHERIPTANWKPLSYNLSIASPYDGIRFEITKRGNGRGQLANIGAEIAPAAECEGLTVLDPGPRRNGSSCAMGDQCASGRCEGSPTPSPTPTFFQLTCTGCSGASCATGEVCGLGDAFSPVLAIPKECVPAAAKELGDLCLVDGECASGMCARATLSSSVGVCSTCRSNVDCTGNEVCASSWTIAETGWSGPFVCGANQMLASSGAPCASDDDCASNKCNGAVRSQCEDGRACNSPSDCPFGTGSADPLQNGACVTVGVQGGTCQ